MMGPMSGQRVTRLLHTSTGLKGSPLKLLERIVAGKHCQDRMEKVLPVGMMQDAQRLFIMEKYMLCVKPRQYNKTSKLEYRAKLLNLCDQLASSKEMVL